MQAAGFAEQTIPLKLVGDQRAEVKFAIEPGGKIHGTVKDRAASRWRSAQLGFPAIRQGVWSPRIYANRRPEGRYHFDFVPLGEDAGISTVGGEQYLRNAQTKRDVPGTGDREVEVNLILERTAHWRIGPGARHRRGRQADRRRSR